VANGVLLVKSAIKFGSKCIVLDLGVVFPMVLIGKCIRILIPWTLP
jgi:hypothetical protein